MKKAIMVIDIAPRNLHLIRKYYLGIDRIRLAELAGMSDYRVKKGETVPESEEAQKLCNLIRYIYEKIKDIPHFQKKGVILQ